MNKKKYQKPEMQVYPLMNSKPLLVGSAGDQVYTPYINKDMNQMA